MRRLKIAITVPFLLTGRLPAHAEPAALAVGEAIRLSADRKAWAEVTSAIVRPGLNPGCIDGRLLVSASYITISTKLDGTDRRMWRLPKASADPKVHGETIQPWVIHDQHMVALKDGSVLLSVEAVTWNNNISPHPLWWDWSVDYPLKGKSAPGGRATIYMFRTPDCGTTWSLMSEIDAAMLPVKSVADIVSKPNFARLLSTRPPQVGLCGVPRPPSLFCDRGGGRQSTGEKGRGRWLGRTLPLLRSRE